MKKENKLKIDVDCDNIYSEIGINGSSGVTGPSGSIGIGKFIITSTPTNTNDITYTFNLDPSIFYENVELDEKSQYEDWDECDL